MSTLIGDFLDGGVGWGCLEWAAGMATIYEIAEKAGVSPKTAARILKGESRRSKHYEKVHEWAKKLGYVRNVSAANLRSKRSHMVGLVVPFVDNPYYTQLIQEFHDALSSRGYQVLLVCSFGKVEAILSALDLFRSYGVDGVFVNGSEGSLTGDVTERLRQLQENRRPVMLLGRGREEHGVDQADVDSGSGIARIVDYLAGRGHARIGFIGGRASNAAMQERKRGFEEGMESTGLVVRPEWMSWGEATPDDAGRRARAMLEGDDRPTALVCGNDLMALGVLKACHTAGLKVPEDVAVTGFDDIRAASLVDPGLTTLRQPYKRLAQECAARFERRIEDGDFEGTGRLLFDTELIVRESA